jgi:hypothetical protein
MQRWGRRLAIAAGGLFILLVLYVVFSFLFLDFIVDYLWYKSLGYQAYFALRLVYRYAVFAAVTLLFFMVFFLNFWVASRYLGTGEEPEPKVDAKARQRYHEVAKLFRSGSLKVYTPASVILAIVIAFPLLQQWEAALFYVFGSQAGVQDPFYGNDISYYLFSFPIYIMLQRRLVLSFLLLLVGLMILYWLESRVLRRQEGNLPRGAKIHLSFLIFIIFLIEIWDFILKSHQLLYTDTHPLFFGPGFVEMRIILPLIWVNLALLMGTAISLILYINARRALKALILFAAGFLLVLGVRQSDFVPRIVDKYIVKPNEISREATFIENSVQATLAAYHLDKVETREYNIQRVPSVEADEQITTKLRNIPVWDRELLVEVYKQAQEIRPYYDFNDADVDRYMVNGQYQQVFVAPREMNIKDLPESAQNWVNEYLKYTHGYGAVMTPAAQDGGEPMTWLLHNIPPQSDYGLSIQQPAIYYGLEADSPVIAPNDSQEFGYPLENTTVSVNYQGRGGVPLTSFVHKLLFAFYFKEKNIFFTTKNNRDSRILIRRNVTKAIQTMTPYLLLDKDPYVVATSQRIYWIQDAYTISDWYPNAQPYDNKFNYIRNSVKIIVDAYDGTIDYYIADPKDPIVRAYARMYPGFLKDLTQMPAELRAHLRYPRDIFEIQMRIYATYHQAAAETFYKQEDAWEFARVYRGDTPVALNSYYLTLDLINEGRHEFVLLRAMSPKNLDLLRALVVVGCDGTDYGRIIVYSFPKSIVVYGPSQIDALINQDPAISQLFTLWGQAGSEVQRGNMMTLPIGGSIVYIQPVYLTSSARLRIPELQRLIVSQGDTVVMDISLDKALRTMEERLKSRLEQQERRQLQFQVPVTQPGGLPQVAPPPAVQ